MTNGIHRPIKTIILTGPIRSGKTTFLMQTFKDSPHCGGFLTPDVQGLRCFFRLDTKEYLPFEVKKHEQKSDIISIGRFHFDMHIFEMGNGMISDLFNTNHAVFIIDEVGKLEINGFGFDKSIKEIGTKYHENTNIKLILVVRQDLVDLVIKKYHLDAEVIDIREEEKLLLKQ